MTLSPFVIAYAVAAVICAAIATVTWLRRDQSPAFAAALTCVMLGGGWWSVCLAVMVGSSNPHVQAIAVLLTFPGPCVLTASFMCLGLTIARPQWVPRRWMLVALSIEPIVITLAALTNPWHGLVFRGPGAAQLRLEGWTYGPVFWVSTSYAYAMVTVGLALVVWSWWKSPPAFRGQRVAVLIGALIPFGTNAVVLSGGPSTIPDPTPLGFALTGTIIWYAIFRQDLFVFSPVARALIVDQISDAVVVVSTNGRILDLNVAASDLLQSTNPWAPRYPVGMEASDLFFAMTTPHESRQGEFVVEFPGGRDEYEVRSSALFDRNHRLLGDVYVARDVTEANFLARRLKAAHMTLVRQVETIDLLRADLAEQASRDPLTGLYNRRYLLEHFPPMLAAAKAAGGTLAVALFDIDYFKAVNDSYGHLAGDAVLVALAQRIQEQVPGGSLVARWGGEEFFVGLPGADAATGLRIADELRMRCARDTIESEGLRIGCTLSGGVAAYPSSGSTMDELFQAADLAMYEAKNAGRNVVRQALKAMEPMARHADVGLVAPLLAHQGH